MGTHQYLSFFSGGRVLVFACVCTPVWWSDDLAIFAVWAVFFACVWCKKKKVW